MEEKEELIECLTQKINEFSESIQEKSEKISELKFENFSYQTEVK